MKQRILTSIVALLVLLPILIFSGTWFFPIAIAVCCVIAVFEMLRCLGLHRMWAVSIPTYITAAVVPFALRLLNDRVDSQRLAALAVVGAVLYLMVVSVFGHDKVKFSQLGGALLSCLYIILGFNAILYLRDLPLGEYIYLLVFLGAWMTDTFAYFTGMLLGRHKLIPAVSPKKTIEGSIGGTVFCILTYVLFGFLMAYFGHVEVNYIALGVSGMVVAVVSQIGDLCMSVVKREQGIKDYGKLFPGHGGMMDRFDSILAVASVLAVICSLVTLISPAL